LPDGSHRRRNIMHATVPHSSPGPRLVPSKLPAPKRPQSDRSFLSSIIPGIIAGAANDDPCAVGTYAKAGAAFGFSFLWTAPVTFPMMAATVYLCSKLSLVTGKGLAGIIRDYYPRWFSYSLLIAVLIANVIEAGANIGAIAASLRLLIPVPVTGITIGITLVILALQTWSSYQLLQKIFAGLGLALFAYVGAAVLAKPDAREFLWATVSPRLHFTREYLAMLVALIGCRLSPYLYFWQSSQKVEEETLIGRTEAVSNARFRSTALDVNAGMFFSNLIMYFVILSTAATLFRNGQTNIVTAQQAAEALRPLAGNAASFLFAIGIIGVGVLAVPVLTTGPADAIAEMRGWNRGLRKNPEHAPEFYAVIALSTVVAIIIGVSSINPINALFWASLIMGLLTPPLMSVIMLSVNDRRIMGAHTNGTWVKLIGWTTTATVTAASAALTWSFLRSAVR
jgi:NRAMP (natural resistance-associated macrophage protein)-like metal ion transporter